MLGLFRKSPESLARAAQGPWLANAPGALGAIQKRSRKDQLKAYVALARLLVLDDEFDRALPILDLAERLDPGNAAVASARAECQGALGDDAAVEAHLRAQLADHPGHVQARATLAQMVLDAEGAEAALAVLDAAPKGALTLDLVRAEVYFAQGHGAEAGALAQRVAAAAEGHMKSAVSEDDFYAYQALNRSALRLHDAALAETGGAEAVVVAAANRGDLDTRAAVNFTLLGQSLMASATTLGDPRLRAPGAREAQGVVGLAEAHLREGRFGPARDAIEALMAEGESFAAYLGRGWLMRGKGPWRFVRGLPEVEAEPWAGLFANFDAFNPEERRIIAASVGPLQRMCDRLCERGVAIHVLPLDARPSDVPGWASLRHGHTDDHRASDAVGGMARPSGAIVRLDELWHVGPKGDWTLAHEFAHLALFHMDDAEVEAVGRLYGRALGEAHVGGDYQRGNLDEFFAMGYQDWLTRRFGGDGVALADDAGVAEDLGRFIEKFGASL